MRKQGEIIILKACDRESIYLPKAFLHHFQKMIAYPFQLTKIAFVKFHRFFAREEPQNDKADKETVLNHKDTKETKENYK